MQTLTNTHENDCDYKHEYKCEYEAIVIHENELYFVIEEPWVGSRWHLIASLILM